MALCLVLLLGCMPVFQMEADAADTGGISTYLSDFGFKGKTISILGDSISTFENYSNGTAADTTNSTIRGNYVYYYEDTVSTYGVDVNDTWWKQTADLLGMRVLVNNSWSGSRVINFGTGTPSAYIDRSQQLHDDTGSNAGEKPDIIVIYLGTNDMKNADDPGDITTVDYDKLKTVSSSYTPTTVFEAYALMLYRAIKKYPNAEIYCMTLIPYQNITMAQKTTMLEFNAGVKKIAQHYGVNLVDLYNESGLTAQSECFSYHMANRLHPGPYGMDAITNCLVNSMLENSQYNTSGQTLVPITYDLKDVYVKGGTIQNALKDKALSLSFGTRSGFDLDITVTMGGVDITNKVVDGTLTVGQVTGPIHVTAKSRIQYQKPENFHWKMSSNHMLSVNDDGAVYNGATLIAGSCASSVFTTAQYSLDKPVVLFHDRPWVIEWKSTGEFTNGALMLSGSQNGKAEGNTYLFRRGGSSLLALGYSDGSSYHNYGLDLSAHSIDATVSHTYRLVNHINSDGSNMVYLYVDNNKLGAMNNYYLGTTNKNTTSNWISGQDLVFTQMGTDGHPLNAGTLNYLRIYENGAPTEVEPKTYRWEPENGSFTAITGDGFTENPLQQLAGSITTVGKFTGGQFTPEENIVLLHDRPWSIEWSSSGTWKDAANGAFLLSASDVNNAVNGAYLYRRTGSELIAFGQRTSAGHENYGISLAAHGIDGSAQHTYRLTNRINGDGSNMVYLYVDGVELGAMNNYFLGGTDKETTNNWLNGRDFTFPYVGTAQFPIGNCTLQYLQIWEGGTEPADYRWEMQSDKLTSITTDGFVQNNLTTLAGTISSGKLSASRFQLGEPVTLRHNLPWSMEWKSSGNWKESSNGAIFFSTNPTSTEAGTVYLYRRSGSTFIALGTRSGGKHLNYGVSLDGHGIDGTVEHTYRLSNRVAADGSNMIYLFVDDVEIGPMNEYFVGGTAQNTTDNWVNGRDFVFTYMGSTDFPIGNCKLDYLQIRENADETHTYRWETQNNTLTSITTDGFTENKVTAQAGSISGTTYTDSYFALDKTVVLEHTKPWSVEWESKGSWSNSNGGALLFAYAPVSGTEGNIFLYRRKNSTLMGLGTYTGGKYHNYGLTLSDHGIDGTTAHVYRLTNRVYGNGTNMVYLYVDGVEVGPMNGYYLGGTAQNTTSDWLSGQDLRFSYFGTQSHTISSCDLSYIQIWEDGIPGGDYRWETQNDVLVDITTDDFQPNEATQLSGTITDGTYSGAKFALAQAVTLRHDAPWTIRWQSEGTWKDAQNGTLLLASHTEKTEGMTYLYRRSNSDLIGFGIISGGAYVNYGIKLANYGIDGTVAHEYLLANRVNEDGSNMVYLFVDGREVGPLDQYFPSAKETFTYSNWISGRDFSFAYLGTSPFTIGNCSIGYLQVREAGEPAATVTFQNWDGTVLETAQYLPGEKVIPPTTIPERPSDAAASYTFVGWSPEVEACGGDMQYTAVYDSDYIDYTVQFLDYDGKVLAENTYHYGDAITVPTSPVRPADGMYTYTFIGWDHTVESCTGNAVYTAVYGTSRIDYLVEFVDEDGSVLSSVSYYYGDMPVAPKNPTKAATAQYTYTFAGWTPEVTAVTDHAIYTASYTAQVNSYTVTFCNDDGSVLSQTKVPYGQMPVAPVEPTKAATAEHSFTFTGWNKTIEKVTGDVTYTAVYSSEVNSYTITFLDDNGTVLSQSTVPYGQMPTAPENPTKEVTAQYTYTFAGWSPEVTAVTGNATYTATYTALINSYTVTFCDEDGSVLSTGKVPYGQLPSVPENPTKPATAQYTYTFTGWDREIMKVTADAVYTAVYQSILNEYTVTFLDEDGAVLQSATVPYGQLPTVPTEPTKEGDAQYTYFFSGWSPAVEVVTSEAVYTAQYRAAINTYTVTFCDESGAVLSRETLEYGTAPTVPVDPVKPADPVNSYRFSGWTPAVTTVVGDAVYTAEYEAVAHDFAVVVTAPTCTKDGFTTYTCKDCGYGYDSDSVTAPGHDYQSVVTQATCTAAGYTVYTCDRCGDCYTADETAALGHQYQSVVTAPSCTEAGYTTHTCKACDYSYVADHTAALGHSYRQEIITPNCTEAGMTVCTCQVCGHSYTADHVSALGHAYETVETQPTCTEPGYSTDTCSICGHQVVRVTAPHGHQYESSVHIPTCTAEGFTAYTCTICNHHYTDDVLPALGHSYEMVTTPPTCTENGQTVHICTICEYSYVAEVVPALGHSYDAVVTAPTCTEDGFTVYTCTVCGICFTGDVISAEGHQYTEGLCSQCGEKDPSYIEIIQPGIGLRYPTLTFEDVIVMNVYYTASDLESVEEMGLITYTQKVEQWSVENAEFVVPGYDFGDTAGMYYSTTQAIAPKNLGDTIYFAVYAKLRDGSYVYTSLIGYSPKTYAYNQLKNGNDETKRLMVAMLNYGTAAQNYFDYFTDTPVNGALTEDQKALIDAYSSDMMASVIQPDSEKLGQMVNNGGYVRRYPTISFEGAFCINYYFLPAETPVGDITMYVWNQRDFYNANTLSKDNATEAITMELTASGEYLAVIEDIAAKDLDQAVYVSFCYSDGTTEYCSGVTGYSIGVYCTAQAAKTGLLAELAAATAVYGYYAKELFYV